MLMWCLKQVKEFIFEFSLSGSFFPEKEFVNLHIIVLVSFPLGEFVDEVVNNRANYQGYENEVHFLQYHTLTVMYFMNGEEIC